MQGAFDLPCTVVPSLPANFAGNVSMNKKHVLVFLRILEPMAHFINVIKPIVCILSIILLVCGTAQVTHTGRDRERGLSFRVHIPSYVLLFVLFFRGTSKQVETT